jgi:hypothetical protein
MDSQKQGHVTRIDCTLDDRVASCPLATIRAAIAAGQCVTRAERVQSITSGLLHRSQAVTGETIYFGSPQSQTLLRIYDKRLEMQSKDREDWRDYGIRWELELKKQRAQVCAQCLGALEPSDWREFLVGLLRSYVDFRETTSDASDEEWYRAPLTEWYAALTEGFQKGRLMVQKEEQTLRGVKRRVSDSITPMLAVICATPGGESWLMNICCTASHDNRPFLIISPSISICSSTTLGQRFAVRAMARTANNPLPQSARVPW